MSYQAADPTGDRLTINAEGDTARDLEKNGIGNMLLMGIMCSTMGLVSAFVISGIYFLVFDVAKCSLYSPLWTFALVYMMSPCCIPLLAPCILPVAQIYTKDKNAVHFLTSAITSLAIALYGLLVITDPVATCSDMREAGLYVWSWIAIIWNIFIGMISLCSGLAIVAFGFETKDIMGEDLAWALGDNEDSPSETEQGTAQEQDRLVSV
jgi:hypothetical protein